MDRQFSEVQKMTKLILKQNEVEKLEDLPKLTENDTNQELPTKTENKIQNPFAEPVSIEDPVEKTMTLPELKLFYEKRKLEDRDRSEGRSPSEGSSPSLTLIPHYFQF